MRKFTVTVKLNRLFSVSEIVVMLILLFAFMDFRLYSMHLMILAFLLCGLIKGRVRVANSVFPLVILSISLILFKDGNILSPTAWALRLVWPSAFLLGYNLMIPAVPNEEEWGNLQKKVLLYYTIAAVGFFIHILLNIYANWGENDIYRNTVDFWTGKSRAATGQAGLMCIPMAWCIAYILGEHSWEKKISAVFAIAIMMYYNLMLGSRTVVLSAMLVSCIALLCVLLGKENNKKKFRIVVVMMTIVVVVLFLFQLDIGGIRTMLEESTLSERLTGGDFTMITGDSRWKAKMEFLKQMPVHLFGGGNIRRSVGRHAHDVLLDTYDEASVFAFLAVIALLWDSISKLIRLIKCPQIMASTKVMIICVFIIIMIEFCLEPILIGMPWLLMAFCFFHGIITCLVKNASFMNSNPIGK